MTVFCEGGYGPIVSNTKECCALAGVGLTFPVSRLKNEVLSDVQAGAMLANVKA
jgi:hypothetical protein